MVPLSYLIGRKIWHPPLANYLVGGSCRALIAREDWLDVVGGGSDAIGLVFSSVSHDGTVSTRDAFCRSVRDDRGDSRLNELFGLHSCLFGDNFC
jgi:hypothetical protein